MSEVVYSKKQIAPLIKKYGINPETNTLFQNIIKLFADTPNYQVWAVKVIFSKALPFEQLAFIKHWSDENKTLIKSLTKQNIVSYSSPSDLGNLLYEIEGLNMVSLVKNNINRFNTEQRHMLEKAINPSALNGITAHTNRTFQSWYKIFNKFDKLPETRKKKFISLCSAYRDLNAMKEGLAKSTEESYQWNKEDMLAFMQNNAPDCKIVFNKGNIVILEIPSFDDSRKLCGGGRTGWCITREESYFRQYVTSRPGHKQYFFFNFDKPETDEFAHIGFTVEDNKAIVNAHSTKNRALLDEGIKYHGQYMNIYNVFNAFGIKMGSFLRLDKIKGFKWNLESVVRFVQSHDEDLAIAYQKNNRIILKAITNKGIEMLVGHTFIQYKRFNIDKSNSCYILMDFNLESDDDKAVVLMNYQKDIYNMDSLATMIDIYGANIIRDKYLSKIDISTDEFINREKIKPTILLHKLIDEGDEKGAIDLINKQGESFDINYTFNDRVPIFSAINNKMYNLFKVIINHKMFDSSKEDGFGETLLSSLLYAYGTDEVNKSPEDEQNMASMIIAILESDNFDFNIQDINLDTAINIASEKPKMNWILKALASKPNVDINVVNDFNRAALGNAIAKHNVEAIKILGKRPDLIIRDEDKALAKKENINLEKYIAPEPMATETVAKVSKKAINAETESEFSEIFKKVFASLKD